MFPIIYKINTIWIRSQFAKGLASPRWVGIEQSGLGHFSFLRIDARQPLRYDLFCSSLLSRVSWTRWSPKGLAKALGCPSVGAPLALASIPRKGKPAACRTDSGSRSLDSGWSHRASSSLQPPPSMKRNSWRFETPWK